MSCNVEPLRTSGIDRERNTRRLWRTTHKSLNGSDVCMTVNFVRGTSLSTKEGIQESPDYLHRGTSILLIQKGRKISKLYSVKIRDTEYKFPEGDFRLFEQNLTIPQRQRMV